MLPIVACTTLGLKASAVSGLQIMVLMPNQSAIRIMVPKLPGSWTPSRANTNCDDMSVAEICGCCCSNTAITCWGACCRLAFCNSSSVTTIISLLCAIAWLFSLNHCCVAMRHLASWRAKMSPTVLGPSATNTLSALRFFFVFSACIYFILFLLNIFNNILQL